MTDVSSPSAPALQRADYEPSISLQPEGVPSANDRDKSVIDEDADEPGRDRKQEPVVAVNAGPINQPVNAVDFDGEAKARSMQEMKTRPCPSHPDKPLELFCPQDQAFLCTACEREDQHALHSVVTIAQAVLEAKAMLDVAMHKAKQLADASELCHRDLEQSKQKFVAQSTKALETINEAEQRLTAVLRMKMLELRRLVEGNYASAGVEYQKMDECGAAVVAALNTVHQMCVQAPQKTDLEILESAVSVHMQLQAAEVEVTRLTSATRPSDGIFPGRTHLPFASAERALLDMAFTVVAPKADAKDDDIPPPPPPMLGVPNNRRMSSSPLPMYGPPTNRRVASSPPPSSDPPAFRRVSSPPVVAAFQWSHLFKAPSVEIIDRVATCIVDAAAAGQLGQAKPVGQSDNPGSAGEDDLGYVMAANALCVGSKTWRFRINRLKGAMFIGAAAFGSKGGKASDDGTVYGIFDANTAVLASTQSSLPLMALTDLYQDLQMNPDPKLSPEMAELNATRVFRQGDVVSVTLDLQNRTLRIDAPLVHHTLSLAPRDLVGNGRAHSGTAILEPWSLYVRFYGADDEIESLSHEQ